MSPERPASDHEILCEIWDEVRKLTAAMDEVLYRTAIPSQGHDQKVRELLAAWMIQNSFATGHGDTVEDLLKELDWQVKESKQKLLASVLEILTHATCERPEGKSWLLGPAEVWAAVRALGEQTNKMKHGYDCVKVRHETKRSGYLHDDLDDGPYDVDGVLYCGRCHLAMPAPAASKPEAGK